MPLPSVKIEFQNGQLGSVAPSPDGVCGLAVTGHTVASGIGQPNKFDINKPYILKSLTGLANLGITSETDDANAFIYRHVKEFYAQAGEGAELWLMGFADTVLPSDILDQTNNNAKSLLQLAKGRIRCLAVAYNGTEPTDPEDEQALAMLNAQGLAKWATEILYAPLFILLECRNFKKGYITSLADLTTYNYNRVGVLVGDTVEDSKGAAVGLLLGRIAEIPVHRNIGRVRDGAVQALSVYIDGEDPSIADVESINDLGYITFRTFVGKAGYFFSDDHLATAIGDDYHSIARRRSIDKAYRIAYQTMLEKVNDDIPTSKTGGIPFAIAKSWEMMIDGAIVSQMGFNGELGSDPEDPKDKGVKARVEPEQDVVGTSKINMQLGIKPFGYAKYINIDLGFYTKEG